MKRTFFLLFAVVCTLVLTTSCLREETPETLSGTYRGSMEVEVNIPGFHSDDLTITGQQTVVTKADASHVDIELELDLTKHLNINLPDYNLNYGTLTAHCLVGPTFDGETPISGTAVVAGQSVPVWGEYDEQVLDLTIVLGVVTVEFEGVRL